ncbi:HTH domain-containing protein [archaeon]|nr:HTH domain-containing protein [archaeon]
MDNDNNSFEDKVKIAFNKVKDDISQLKYEIESIKSSLNEIKNEIKKETNSSTGNKGVLQQPNNTLTTVDKHHTVIKEAVKDLSKYFEGVFKSLTDKEFTIFFIIYQLEEENERGVSYADIASKLKVSQSFIRGCVAELTLKGAPLEKISINNQKVSLFIKKEFKSMNLAEKLIKFRQLDNRQTTLLEI